MSFQLSQTKIQFKHMNFYWWTYWYSVKIYTFCRFERHYQCQGHRNFIFVREFKACVWLDTGTQTYTALRLWYSGYVQLMSKLKVTWIIQLTSIKGHERCQGHPKMKSSGNLLKPVENWKWYFPNSYLRKNVMCKQYWLPY